MHSMPSALASVKMSYVSVTALCTISIFAVYVKYYLSFQNGFMEMLSSMAAQNSLSSLPGDLCYEYTGFKLLDKFLTASNVFFWLVFQPQEEAPKLPFYGVTFASSMVPMWLVVVFETHRRRRGFWAFMEIIFLAGPLIQCLSPGVAIPIILARFILSKPVSKRGCQSPVGSFSLSISIGYILPLVLAALPAPGVISYNTKQYLIALWQFWPLNTSIIMWSSKGLIPPAFPFDEEVRWACFFTMLCSLGHKLLLLFYYIGGKSNLLLLPSPPWMESRVLTLEAGVLRFLQWDYILSGSAMWIWAIDLHLMTPECSGNIFFALFAQAWLCFVLGPYGMAVAVYGYASSVMSDSSPYVMSDSGLFVMPGNDQLEK